MTFVGSRLPIIATIAHQDIKEVVEHPDVDLGKDLFKSPEVTPSGLLPAFHATQPSHLPTPHSIFSNYITRPSESPSAPSLDHHSRYAYSGPSSAHLAQRPHYSSSSTKHARPIFPQESELAGPSQPNASQVATPSPECHLTRLPPPTTLLLRTPHPERTEKFQGSRLFDTSPASSTLYHSSPEYRPSYDDSDDPFIADPSPRQYPAHQTLLPGHIKKGKNTLEKSFAKSLKPPAAFSYVKMGAEGEGDGEGEDDAEGEADEEEVEHAMGAPLQRSRTPISSPLRPPRTPIPHHYHHLHAHTATTIMTTSADELSTPFLAAASRVQTPLALANPFSQSSTPSTFPRGSRARPPSPDLFNTTPAGFARTPLRLGGEPGTGSRLPSASPFRRSSSPADDHLPKTPPPRPRGVRSASPTGVKRPKDANNALLHTPPPPLYMAAAASPRTPSPPAGGEITRLRRERAALAEARLTASEPRRPEYLVRVVKRARGGGAVEEGEVGEREREMGEREDVALGVTMSPSRGRRLKLYHPVPVVAEAKMRRQPQLEGGGDEPVVEAATTTTPPPSLLPRMDLRAIDWRTPRDLAVPSSSAALPPASLSTTDGGPTIWVCNLEEAEKRRKRLDAFRAAKPSQRGTSLTVVEARGRGRILVDPAKPDVYGLVEWGILPELPTVTSDPSSSPTQHASSSLSARLHPQWPDAHFPWSLDAQQRKKVEEAEQAMRLSWIERFLDRESSSEGEEEEQKGAVILEGENGDEEQEQEKTVLGRKKGGRGKTVVLRMESGSGVPAPVSSPLSARTPSRKNTKKSKSKSKAKHHNPSPSRSLSSRPRIHPGTAGPRHRRRMLFNAPTSDALEVLLSKKRVRGLAHRAFLRRLTEDEEGVVRCICHTGDDGRGMVRCDACRGWYHLVCMDIGDEDELGEEWFCFRCREGEEEKMRTGPKTRIPTFAPDRPLSPPRSDVGDQPLYQPLPPRPGALQPSPIPASPTRTPGGYHHGGGLFSTDESYAPFDPTSTPSRGLRFPVPSVTPRTSRLGGGAWSSSEARGGVRYARVLEEGWGDESPVRRSGEDEEGLEESPRRTVYPFESPVRRASSSSLLNGPFMFESPVRRTGTRARGGESPLAGRGGARWEKG